MYKSSSVGTTSSGEVTVSAPAGMAAGDLLLAWLAVDDASGAGTFPDGWTFGSDGGSFGGGSWASQSGIVWSLSPHGMWLWNMSRTATDDDVGVPISMGTGGSARKTLAVLCYSNLAPPSGDPFPPGFPATTSFMAEGTVDVDFGGTFTETGQLGDEASGGSQDPAAFQIVANSARRILGSWTGIPGEENQSFSQSGGTVRANIAGLLPLIIYEGSGTTSWAWDDSVAFFQGRMLVKPTTVESVGGWGVGMVRMGSN